MEGGECAELYTGTTASAQFTLAALMKELQCLHCWTGSEIDGKLFLERVLLKPDYIVSDD